MQPDTISQQTPISAHIPRINETTIISDYRLWKSWGGGLKVKALRHCIHHAFGHILNSAASSNCLSLHGRAWKCWQFQVTAIGSKSRSGGTKFPLEERWMMRVSVHCTEYLMQSGICFLLQGIFSPVAAAAGAQTFGECWQPGEEVWMVGCRTSTPPLSWEEGARCHFSFALTPGM